MTNLISAFSFAEFFGNVWDALTSKIALIVYASIILVLILVLVIRLIINEHRRIAEIQENDARRHEAYENEQLETVKAALDKKMNKISLDVAAVKRSVSFAPYAAAQVSGMPNAPARVADAPEDTEAAEEVNEGGSRFYMLTEIDKEYE
ncbi:MAG: hypothetical protein K2K38_02080, partial [Clostridia bacterium]|nr:hypothetical protein [Clostridia bacterium]